MNRFILPRGVVAVDSSSPGRRSRIIATLLQWLDERREASKAAKMAEEVLRRAIHDDLEAFMAEHGYSNERRAREEHAKLKSRWATAPLAEEPAPARGSRGTCLCRTWSAGRA